jgi:hypothetical protein
VSPNDIYEFNPDAVDGISQGMVLQVPSEKKVQAGPERKKPADTSLISQNTKKDDE